MTIFEKHIALNLFALPIEMIMWGLAEEGQQPGWCKDAVYFLKDFLCNAISEIMQ